MDRKGRNTHTVASAGRGADRTCRCNAWLKGWLITWVLLLVLFRFPVSALEEWEEGAGGEVLQDLQQSIPEAVRDWLPKGLLTELHRGENADPSEIASMFSVEYLVSLGKKALCEMLHPFLEALSGCLGLTVVAAIVSSFHLLGGESEEATRWLLSLCVALSVWRIASGSFEIMSESLQAVSVFMRALLPSVVIVYTAGGNFSAAVAEEGFLLLLTELIEVLCSDVLKPMLQVAFSLSTVAHVSGEGRLRGLSGSVCKGITLLLSFVMLIMTTVLGYQHTIAASADGFLLRSVKFAASGVVPVIGGAFSEVMGTASGAVEFLRTTVGSIATVVVLILLLIPWMNLLGTRLAMRISALIAQALGCSSQGGLLDELGGIYDLALAIMAICFLAILIAMTLMIRCAVAMG